MTTTTITIKGTHCLACKTLIEEVALEISGIKKCTVDFKTGKTILEHEAKVDWNKFKTEIESLGDYDVLLI